MEYEDMISRIEFFLSKGKDFFIGGRGIGISCKRMAVCWKVEIERAALILYPDSIRLDDYKLQLFQEGMVDEIAEFDLRHYLKVQAI